MSKAIISAIAISAILTGVYGFQSGAFATEEARPVSKPSVPVETEISSIPECGGQVWPNINQDCLSHVADLEIRKNVRIASL